jgi:dihydrofolate reductase
MNRQRRIVMFSWLSANGCFADSDGSLQWVVPDPKQARRAAAEIGNFDTALFGRKTYEIFESFWPHAAVDESGAIPDPHNPGRPSPEHGAVATALNRMRKLVFSRTLSEATWANSRVVRNLDPLEIEAMKRAPGKDIIVFGSGSIVSLLTHHGLVDEYQLAICPILLGNGLPLLNGFAGETSLTLVECVPLGSGDVIVRYGRKA